MFPLSLWLRPRLCLVFPLSLWLIPPPLPCVPTVFVANTPPLPCVPTAFVAKTPPLPCALREQAAASWSALASTRPSFYRLAFRSRKVRRTRVINFHCIFHCLSMCFDIPLLFSCASTAFQCRSSTFTAFQCRVLVLVMVAVS